MLELPSLTRQTLTSSQGSSYFAVVVLLDQINTMHLYLKMFIPRPTRMVWASLQDPNGVGNILSLNQVRLRKLTLRVSMTGREESPAFNNHHNNPCRRAILTSNVKV